MQSLFWSFANGRSGERENPSVRICVIFLLVSVFAIGTAMSQAASSATPEKPAASPQESAANVPELSTQEEIQTFQVKVNLVEVRVVVRDAKGNAVGGLKQEDFLLFDDSKPQTITKFSVERREVGDATVPGATGPQAPLEKSPTEAKAPAVQKHRVAFLFDDVNSTPNDLVNARNAAEQRVNSLQPGESIAIFTISGQGTQDFTSDPEKLRAALKLLKSRPVGGVGLSDCPPINYYIANQILNNHDAQALAMVMQEVLACQFDGNQAIRADVLRAMANSAAVRVLQAGDNQLQITLHTLSDVVRRMTTLSGQRHIVFFTPGFVVGDQQAALTDYLNRAILGGVVISTLDVKGLYTQPASGTDISQKAFGSAAYAHMMVTYRAQSDMAESEPIMQIANATGGAFFHNRNDLGAGLEKLSDLPEYSYLLGFTPQNLKSDGKFHALKVELKQGAGLSLQARKGYYAPKPGSDSDREVQREIADEVFAQNEVKELPVQVQTQFFRSGDDKVHINVLVHIDVRHMAFRKADGRNLNDVTVISALFDRNANFISADSKTVQMHIKDETLATKMNSGITLRNTFDVNPGSYVVRVVARDAQGKLAAQNDVLDIP